MLRLLTVLLLAVPGSAPAAGEFAVFDAHIHYNADARAALNVEAAMARLNRAGVSRALVSSTPNDGTLALHEKYPDRIVPTLRPYRSDADRGSWFRDPQTLPYIERELKRGIYRGIGEFHLYTGEADNPVIRALVALGVRHRLILHAHSDAGAIRELYRIDPAARILWAHAGMDASPTEVGVLLDRHATLSVELSLRNNDIAPDGRLDPAWRDLLLRHADRFLIATDTWAPHRWEEIGAESERARRWLAQLPRPIADRIATGNAERLFPR